MGRKEYEEKKRTEQEDDNARIRGTAMPTVVTTETRTIADREKTTKGRRQSSWFERIKEKRKEMKARRAKKLNSQSLQL